MPTDRVTQNSTASPREKSPRTIDWQYPLSLATTGFVLMGAFAFFHLLLPDHPTWGDVLGLCVTFLWRFGVHRTGVFPWAATRNEGTAYSFNPLWQGVLNGFGFFIFMLFLLSATTERRQAPRLFIFVLAVIGGLAVGAFDRRSRPAQSPPRPSP